MGFKFFRIRSLLQLFLGNRSSYRIKSVIDADGMTQASNAKDVLRPDLETTLGCIDMASGRSGAQKDLQLPISGKKIYEQLDDAQGLDLADKQMIDLLWLSTVGKKNGMPNWQQDWFRDTGILCLKIDYSKSENIPEELKNFQKNFPGFGFWGVILVDRLHLEYIFIRKSLYSSFAQKFLFLVTKEFNVPLNYFLNIKRAFLKQARVFIKLIRLDRRTWWLSVKAPLDRAYLRRSNHLRSAQWLDVVIPVAQKDCVNLPNAVQSIRKWVNHPLGDIFIVGSRTEELLQICNEENCRFVDENEASPIRKDQINLTIHGIDRSGWILQQFIKLNCDSISSSRYILIADSDTVFVHPQIFVDAKNVIRLPFSDEFHLPYRSMYKRLFNFEPKSPVSFVAHHMIVDREILQEMRLEIETKNGGKWWKMILEKLDLSDGSGFAEYETLGNYMLERHPERLSIRYWFNAVVTEQEKMTSWQSGDKDHFTWSCHHYLKSQSRG